MSDCAALITPPASPRCCYINMFKICMTSILPFATELLPHPPARHKASQPVHYEQHSTDKTKLLQTLPELKQQYLYETELKLIFLDLPKSFSIEGE